MPHALSSTAAKGVPSGCARQSSACQVRAKSRRERRGPAAYDSSAGLRNGKRGPVVWACVTRSRGEFSGALGEPAELRA